MISCDHFRPLLIGNSMSLTMSRSPSSSRSRSRADAFRCWAEADPETVSMITRCRFRSPFAGRSEACRHVTDGTASDRKTAARAVSRRSMMPDPRRPREPAVFFHQWPNTLNAPTPPANRRSAAGSSKQAIDEWRCRRLAAGPGGCRRRRRRPSPAGRRSRRLLRATPGPRRRPLAQSCRRICRRARLRLVKKSS